MANDAELQTGPEAYGPNLLAFLNNLRARVIALRARIEALPTAPDLSRLEGVNARYDDLDTIIGTIPDDTSGFPTTASINDTPTLSATLDQMVTTYLNAVNTYNTALNNWIRDNPAQEAPETMFTVGAESLTAAQVDARIAALSAAVGVPSSVGPPAVAATGVYARVEAFEAAVAAKADGIGNTEGLAMWGVTERDRLLARAREVARRASIAASSVRTFSATWHRHTGTVDVIPFIYWTAIFPVKRAQLMMGDDGLPSDLLDTAIFQQRGGTPDRPFFTGGNPAIRTVYGPNDVMIQMRVANAFEVYPGTQVIWQYFAPIPPLLVVGGVVAALVTVVAAPVITAAAAGVSGGVTLAAGATATTGVGISVSTTGAFSTIFFTLGSASVSATLAGSTLVVATTTTAGLGYFSISAVALGALALAGGAIATATLTGLSIAQTLSATESSIFTTANFNNPPILFVMTDSGVIQAASRALPYPRL